MSRRVAITAFLARNAGPIALTGALAAFVATVSPTLFVPDTWMALVGGREVWQNGIPETERLTVLASGERWIDQQWAGQLLLFGVEQVGGTTALGVLCALLVAGTYGSAMAAARLLGASARAAWVTSLACLLAAPWAWQVRTQLLALPLFVWVLWLAAGHVRRPSRRLLVALPLLVPWANVHGSVLVGVLLTALAAAWAAVRSSHHRALSATVAALALLAPFATPYGFDIVDYYRAMLVNPPFAEVVSEWRRTPLDAFTVPFLLLAGGTAVVAVHNRQRLTGYELAVLAVTLVLGVQAVRGIAWFALSAAVLLPNSVNGLLPGARSRRRATLVAVAALTAGAVALAVLAARPSTWLDDRWPDGLATAVVRANSDTRVFAAGQYADWLLWREKGLAGRLANDLRWELYSRSEIERITAFERGKGADWPSITAGYDVVVLDTRAPRAQMQRLLAKGLTIVYWEGDAAVLLRAGD